MQTKGLSAPWQWPGLGPSKKSEKRTNQYPTPVIFHSSYPIFHLSCTCLHSGESHCPHFLTTSVTPAVEISLCSRGILQLFQRIARHSSYHIAMKSISLPQSHWWPALCLTGDECITVNSEACLKKNWPSKNLVCSSLPLSGIHPRTQSSNVKEIDFDFFNYYVWLFAYHEDILRERDSRDMYLPQPGIISVAYCPLFYNCIMSKKIFTPEYLALQMYSTNISALFNVWYSFKRCALWMLWLNLAKWCKPSVFPLPGSRALPEVFSTSCSPAVLFYMMGFVG